MHNDLLAQSYILYQRKAKRYTWGKSVMCIKIYGVLKVAQVEIFTRMF